MPNFKFSQALTANQRDFRPLANWKYRRLPFDAYVRVLTRSTTAGGAETISAGAQELTQRSIIQGGGTAAVTPSALNTPPTEFVANAGDEIIISIDETLAGTPTIDGIVYVDPA